MFSFQTRITLAHTDAAGVVFFPRQLELAHTAFEDLMRHIGWALETMLTEGRWLLPVVRAEADYRHPLRLGNELTIGIGLQRLGDSSFTLAYTFTHGGHTAGTFTTTHTLLSAEDFRPRPLPADLRTALTETLAEA
jgi:YbgC/YbaW family acyl-CoA thioester hydrolase